VKVETSAFDRFLDFLFNVAELMIAFRRVTLKCLYRCIRSFCRLLIYGVAVWH